MRALITGITGFAGSHLAEFLLGHDVEVFGTRRLRSRMEHIHHIRNCIHLIECELRDPVSVDRLIQTTKPDYIFHLAAQSFVPTSWNSPSDTLSNNILNQVNILESVRKAGLPCKIQLACSSEEYGLVLPDEVPIREENPLRPLSPYAVSKIAQDFLGYQYFKSYGIPVIRTRTFNHEGPRRGEAFVLSNFAKQIAEIELGLRKPILYVGNLSAKRDFTDVRDIVRAYWLALEKGEPGEVYNIGTGLTWTIEYCLNQLLLLTDKKIDVQVDPERLRPSDVEILQADYTKFAKQTGWQPTISLNQTIEDTLTYWRQRLSSNIPSE